MDKDLILQFSKDYESGKNLDKYGVNGNEYGEDGQKNSDKNSSKRTITPPPDIVNRVTGSTAGVGSEYIDIYRRIRRKEQYRLKTMEEEKKKVC